MLNRGKKIILFLNDMVALGLALFLTIALRYNQSVWQTTWNEHWPNFLPVFLLWLIILYINGLYDLNLKTTGRQFLASLGNTAVVSILLSTVYFYLRVSSDIAPKTNLLIFSVLFIIIFFIFRSFYQAVIFSDRMKQNLAIIGQNEKTDKILEELKKKPGAGYNTALIFKNVLDLASLRQKIRDRNIHAIIVCDDFGNNGVISNALFNCLEYQLNFFDYPDFYELITGKIPVEEIDQDWFLENLKEGSKGYFDFIKKNGDFVLALILFLITLPFWPLIALIIKLESRGPIFFRQTRLGKNENEFRIIKFRSMREENNDRSHTVEGDERITRFGQLLRRTRIDEIPQVLNVLKGDMSFIGPRPERPEIIKKLENDIPFYKTRLLIKPGLTGWDQVSGQYHSATTEDSLEKLQYDLYYLRHRSAYLDFTIALKTLSIIFGRGGR